MHFHIRAVFSVTYSTTTFKMPSFEMHCNQCKSKHNWHLNSANSSNSAKYFWTLHVALDTWHHKVKWRAKPQLHQRFFWKLSHCQYAVAATLSDKFWQSLWFSCKKSTHWISHNFFLHFFQLLHHLCVGGYTCDFHHTLAMWQFLKNNNCITIASKKSLATALWADLLCVQTSGKTKNSKTKIEICLKSINFILSLCFCRQYYVYITDTRSRRLGTQAWVLM